MSSRGDDANPERLGGTRDGKGESLAGLMEDVWGEAPQSVPSIGDYLAKQRQLRGISRDELCTMTRIPMRSLERLESGAFDTLDDGFVRGFVRTVASALGLDPDDTLARMTQEPDAPLESTRRIASVGVIRAGVLAAGLVLVLISVGLVRIAVQYLPGQDVSSDIVMRSDPVRALAEARGTFAIDASDALTLPTQPPAATRDDLVLPATARLHARIDAKSSSVEEIEPVASVDAGPAFDTRARAHAVER